MVRRFFMLLLAACWLGTARLEAAVKMSLTGQLQALANDVKDNLKNNPLVVGQRVALGKFDPEGPRARESNYGMEIERQLKSLLADVLSDDATLTLAGSYHYVKSDQGDNAGLEVLLLTAQIKNERGKEVVAITREVNDTDDIFHVLGLTGSAPHDRNASFKDRNAAAQQAAKKPAFEVQNGYRVAALGLPQWSVGILKKKTFDGPTEPGTPQDVKGKAFVNVGVGEYYEIELVNNDKADAVATITVDGLDVANKFSEDKDSSGKPVHYPGYFVAHGSPFVIRGWLHSVKRTGSKDNVFTFLVTELGQGAASALKVRGAIGVITVQFREACEPDAQLTRRSFGETTKGEGLEEKYTLKSARVGENVLSTVSLRYNRPE
jgi:hypothetical protein